MLGFPETFGSRITRWVEQNLEAAAPEDVDARAEDALKGQLIIEAAIDSWENDSVVTINY